MEELNEDLAEFARLLKEEGVRHLICGGYSVAPHGFPRYTGNSDFFVTVSPENSAKLVNVFEEFGFGELGLKQEDFSRCDYVVETELSGMTLKFLGKDDLIANKGASGRPKDKIDLLELE